MLSIEWVRISTLMPNWVRIVYAASAALLEEIFFRGAIFVTWLHLFPGRELLGVAWVTFLFLVQQILTVKTAPQAVLIGTGAISISLLGCLLLLFTKSLIPCLICHEIFVLMFLGLRPPAKQTGPKIAAFSEMSF